MSTDEFNTEMELYGVSPGVIAFIMFPLTLLNILCSFYPVVQGLPLAIWFFYTVVPLNLVFAIWFVRFYQAKSSKDSMIMMGLLSITLPTLIHLFVSTYLFTLSGVYLVILPIPIQFIAGLIILRQFDGPEVISPWSGMRLDLSWWKRQNPKRKSDWDPLEDKKKEDWLEG